MSDRSQPEDEVRPGELSARKSKRSEFMKKVRASKGRGTLRGSKERELHRRERERGEVGDR